MEKFAIVLVFCCSAHSVLGQQLGDTTAFYEVLQNRSVDGRYTWQSDNKTLKALAWDMLNNDSTNLTRPGMLRLVELMTRDDYDPYYDSLFINLLLSRTTLKELLLDDDLAFVRNHFLRSNYDSTSLQQLSFLARPQSALFWKPWTPDYLVFLRLEPIGETLQLLSKNLISINALNPSLHLDSLSLRIKLARLGLISDTSVVDQIEQMYPVQERLEQFAAIRTPYSFDKIGSALLGEVEGLPANWSEAVRQRFIKEYSEIALSFFIRYVRDFPDRSTKKQDLLDRGLLVRFSDRNGKDYSTPEYLTIARSWYRKHRNKLILDQDKF